MSTLADQLHELGAPYAGVVLSGELCEAGVGRSQLRTLVRRGWLTAIRRGAFLVGGGAPTDLQILVAAYRLAGPNAVVSHWSAARLHRMPVAGGTGPELTIIGRPSRKIAGTVVHRSSRLSAAQVATVRGLRVTTPARTLADIAQFLPVEAVGKVVDEGLIARSWTISELEAVVSSAPRRAATGNLRRVLALRIGGPSASGRFDSPLEVRVANVLASCRPFEVNFQVVIGSDVYVLDIAWPPFRVAVETDGFDVRAKSRSKFDHERRKFNVLQDAGWTVIHVTAVMSDDEIRGAVVRALLKAAGAVNTTGG